MLHAKLISVHTELLATAWALAMQKKWVEYPFLAMPANAQCEQTLTPGFPQKEWELIAWIECHYVS